MVSEATASTALEEDSKVSGRAWAILAAMGFGAFIAQMFGSIIANALPQMQKDLNLSAGNTTWIASGYFLAFGVGLIAGGRLGDLIGEVKMVVIGYSVFGVTLITAAIAPDGLVLILSRIGQGLGIGISAPATLTIVVNSFPVLRRGMAVGTWGAAHGIGIALGPILGGAATDSLGWRYIFWLTVPLDILVIVVTIIACRTYKSVLAKGSYDVIGLILGGAGVTALVYGLQISSAKGWSSPTVIAYLVAAVILLIAFYIVEHKVKHPLVDFGLFKERLFSGGFLAEFGIGLVYLPMLTFVGGFYLITVLGFSPLEAGFVILPTTGVAALLQPISGRVMDRFGPGRPIAVGMILAGISLFWLTQITPETTFAMLLGPFLIMGVAVSLVLPGGNTAGMLAVDAKRAGMGAGVLQMAFVLCNGIGIAVVTSMLGSLQSSQLDDLTSGKDYAALATQYDALVQSDPASAAKLLAGLPEATQQAITAAANTAYSTSLGICMGVLGVVSIVGAVLAYWLIGKRRRPDHIEMTHAAAI